jgi:hypothetical protein
MLGKSPLQQPEGVFTWDSYRSFVLTHKDKRHKAPFRDWLAITEEYGHRLPIYVLARCPECGRSVPEPIDTFSLNGFMWGLQGNAGAGWSGSLQSVGKKFGYCEHVQIVSWFLNLNGLLPDDLFEDQEIYRPGPEIPSLMVVPATVPGVRLVMQHLRIGRFDDDVLTPRYSLYFLTYFAQDADAFGRATLDVLPDCSLERSDTVRDCDLARYANEERLLWIDSESPDQRLVSVKDAPFPYGSIEGERGFDFVITRRGIEPTPRRGLFGLLERLAWGSVKIR